jgi:hypothetical protein
MRYDKMPRAEPRDGDPPVIAQTIATLERAGADPRRPPNNSYQLKVSPDLNYYPAKGTIYRDGAPSPLPDRGLEALIQLLRDEGLIRPGE